MEVGLNIKTDGLYFDQVKISNLGAENSALRVTDGVNRLLKFNGITIATGGEIKNGFSLIGRTLYFDGVKVGESEIIDPELPDDPFVSPEGYWITPMQESALSIKNMSYNSLIGMYESLRANNPTYVTRKRYEDSLGNPILSSYGNFEMWNYVFAPPSYSRTFFIGTGVHGNERDAPLTVMRIVSALCNNSADPAYEELMKLRNDVRIVVIPAISPYGYEDRNMNIPFDGSVNGINLNRAYDFNHQYGIPGSGVAGNYPFELNESKHVRDSVNFYGSENINMYLDMHDGYDIYEHYWITYSADGPNKFPVKNFVNYMLEKHEVEDPVIPHVKESRSSGSAQNWASKTMGMVASTAEWMGGLFGYTFDGEQMRHSMEIRSNVMLMAYNLNWMGNLVSPQNGYFHIDYAKSFTRNSLRREGASDDTKVFDPEIYARWDLLQSKYPTKITKSTQLGTDVTGAIPIHTYTFGSGSKKVLYVGGVMRFGGTHKIDEYAIYQTIEYLCTPHFLNQSTHLQELNNDYTIIVLPFIDNEAGNNDIYRNAGLNQTVISPKRWQIVADKTIPSVNGATNHGVVIVKNLIDNNPDLKCIVSGGEIMEGYSINPKDYTTDYETQFVIPRNQAFDLTSYKTHLETNRVENVVVENTKGLTFGDYAFDQFGIKTYFIQLKVSAARWAFVQNDLNVDIDSYAYHNYESGRRIANIVNVFLK